MSTSKKFAFAMSLLFGVTALIGYVLHWTHHLNVVYPIVCTVIQFVFILIIKRK
jgi:hypothetical protein